MEEIIFFVIIFFIDVFPLIREALGSFFLVFPEGIKIGDGVDGLLPFLLYCFGQLLFPDFEKILMSLEKIGFQLAHEYSRDAVNNRVPRVVSRDNTGCDMGILFLEDGDIEWFAGKRIREVREVVLTHSKI